MKEKLSIDSDIGLLSDAFTVDMPAFDYWDKETVKVTAGYEGKEITVIDGLVDEWVLNITQSNAQLALRGRDYMKLGIKKLFNKVYFYKKPDVWPVNRFGVPIPYAYGRGLTARTVASDACTLAGLQLSWEAPDYPIVNAIEPSKGFNSSVSAVLRELIAPIDLTELYKIDIWVQGDTVFVKKRSYPYTADYTYDLTELLVGNIALTKTSNDRQIRDIYIAQDVPEPGSPEALEQAEDEAGQAGGDGGSGDGGLLLGYHDDTEIIETFENESTFAKVLTREIKTTTKFGDVVLKVVKQVYTRLYNRNGNELTSNVAGQSGLFLTEDTTEVSNFQAPIHAKGYNKILSKNNRTIIYEQAPDKNSTSPVFKSKEVTEVVSYAYSLTDELIVQDSVKHTKEFKPDGSYKMSTDTPPKPINIVSRETVTHEKITTDQIQTTTTKTKDGAFVSQEKVTLAGQLPGPKKVGATRNHGDTLTKNMGPNTPNTDGSTTADDTIHEDTGLKWQKFHVNDTGEDIEIDSNLLPWSLLQQLAQEKKQEELLRQYRLSMRVLPAPWMRKGHGLKLNTVLSDGLGGTIDLRPFTFLITKIGLERNNNSFRANMEAIGWGS